MYCIVGYVRYTVYQVYIKCISSVYQVYIKSISSIMCLHCISSIECTVYLAMYVTL